MWKIECIACRLCKTTNQFTSYWVINVAVKVRTVRSFEIFTARDGIEHLAWEKSETKIEESLSASNSTSLQDFITCSTYHILKHVIQNFIELFQAHFKQNLIREPMPSQNCCTLQLLKSSVPGNRLWRPPKINNTSLSTKLYNTI